MTEKRKDVYQASAEDKADGLPVSQPFVLDKGYLYWQRYWQHEVEVATQLLALSTHQHTLSMPLEPFFDDKYQQDAAKMALSKQLTVITGYIWLTNEFGPLAHSRVSHTIKK